jgi:hypothetical protein
LLQKNLNEASYKTIAANNFYFLVPKHITLVNFVAVITIIHAASNSTLLQSFKKIMMSASA